MVRSLQLLVLYAHYGPLSIGRLLGNCCLIHGRWKAIPATCWIAYLLNRINFNIVLIGYNNKNKIIKCYSMVKGGVRNFT